MALLNVYYSVNTFGNGDLKTASPNLTMTGGVATISTAQTGNIGVGCRVTYDTSKIAYISEYTSSTSFKLVTALGATPSDEGSSVPINSIRHEFASMSLYEAGFTDANHINNTSLVSADVIANAPCYHDQDDDTKDTTGMTWGGPTIDPTRRIKVFTPTGGTESAIDQRWDGSPGDIPSITDVYKMESTSTPIALGSGIRHIDFDGIYMHCTNTTSSVRACIGSGAGSGSVNDSTINHCIMRFNDSGDTNRRGLDLASSGNAGSTIDISNTIIFGAGKGSGTSSGGIVHNSDGDITVSLLNVTITDFNNGVLASQPTTVTNCAVFDNTDDFNGAGITVTFTASEDEDGTDSQLLDATGTPAYANEFVDAPAGDFALVSGGVCEENGTDLSGSGVTDDIIGVSRPQSTNYDIGAFELVSAPAAGRIMSSLTNHGGLAGMGGIAGKGGGLAG